jgi:glycine/D-amino acid oxidase-like deaminating enzyme
MLFRMSTRSESAVAIVGGGFYGCVLALHLRRQGLDAVLVEREPALLRRASYANQARVHNGYHYPRSLVTARRSRVNFPRFVADYRECIDDSFEKIYAIARTGSKVTAAQFVRFCRLIDAPIEPAPPEIAKLFDPRRVEGVFRVRETAFDAEKLGRRLSRELAEAGVEVRLGVEAERVEPCARGLRLRLRGPDGAAALDAARVYNCTYSRLNALLDASGLPRVALKQELAELCLVELPEALRGLGVTLMCGPFFSCMPFPPRGLHSLSHVRYTPRCEWQEGPDGAWRDPAAVLDAARRRSAFPHMLRDALRYLPALGEARHVDSLWEIKTVLPRNEVDDGRPILLVDDCGLPGLSCVMGSKLDNVYDVLDCLSGARAA